MDINYLLYREQIERERAERAASDEARAAHRGLAQGYREQVEDHRRSALEAAGITPKLRPPSA
ncbi:MAG: hypothetical protein M3177_02680 [Pseudomonadota bacterium]|nr:hypothetical protein [Pseudomonadota bacterium]